MASAGDEEEILKSGPLEKLGGGEGGRQNWKKRFFVYKTKTLEYYESENVSRPLGEAMEGLFSGGSWESVGVRGERMLF